MKRHITIVACGVLAVAGLVRAQGTTTLSVVVPAEASLTVTTGTTSLSTSGSNFSTPYSGTTSFTYQVRTTKVGGTGTISAKVTSDFPATGGPSVATPPTAGDALTYTCTVSSPGTGCTGSQTASTAATTSVATFGAGAKSTKAGNTGSLAWSLTDDPVYDTGTYAATVTFTVSAT
ncbi:MAG: hypothetical protein WDO73_07105 [Ignavibacteriota bacterium]